jgi:hypothetical protein
MYYMYYNIDITDGAHVYTLGYSDFEHFWKTDMRHIVLDQKNNSKNILDKAFFKHIFSGFLLN